MLMERRVTCSISPGMYSQKLVWYFANIFSNGRSLYHHWTLGIRCLKHKGIIHILLRLIINEHLLFEKNGEFAYSKSVSAFSSVTGTNEMTFLLRPSTHAVSGELANTRSDGTKAVESLHRCDFLSNLFTSAMTLKIFLLYLVWSFQSISLKSTGSPSHPTSCQNFCQREKVPLPGAQTHKLSVNMLQNSLHMSVTYIVTVICKLLSCVLPESCMAAPYLLEVSQHVDSAVKDALPLWWVQPMDEICGVVFVAFFIPVVTKNNQQRKN